MEPRTRRTWAAAFVAIAPVVLLAGFAYHPFIDDPTDRAQVAAAIPDDAARWQVAHLLVGVGGALLAYAFVPVRDFLRDAGERRWSGAALPLLVVGGALFCMLPAMEIALAASAEGGAGAAEVAATQAALDTWFFPTLIASGVLFIFGAVALAVSVVKSRVLPMAATWLVVGALVVMAALHVVPLGASLVVSGVAGVISLWPLSYAMWTRGGNAPERQDHTSSLPGAGP